MNKIQEGQLYVSIAGRGRAFNANAPFTLQYTSNDNQERTSMDVTLIGEGNNPLTITNVPSGAEITIMDNNGRLTSAIINLYESSELDVETALEQAGFTSVSVIGPLLRAEKALEEIGHTLHNNDIVYDNCDSQHAIPHYHTQQPSIIER